MSADGRCSPLSLVVSGGQRADCTQFQTVLAKIRVPRTGSGRPRTKPDSIAADKGYSNGPCREYLRRRGIRHTIPEKSDSGAARLRKGSRGGRPPGESAACRRSYGRAASGDATCSGGSATCRASSHTGQYVVEATTPPRRLANRRPSLAVPNSSMCARNMRTRRGEIGTIRARSPAGS
ncbi:transposase [Streptomyces sp. NPDC005820]|uniref:transposase n=1 Tax=Streptomyces sp. NPDC005820 TaxID=3157069 RepID=UPI0033D5F421